MLPKSAELSFPYSSLLIHSSYMFLCIIWVFYTTFRPSSKAFWTPDIWDKNKKINWAALIRYFKQKMINNLFFMEPYMYIFWRVWEIISYFRDRHCGRNLIDFDDDETGQSFVVRFIVLCSTYQPLWYNASNEDLYNSLNKSAILFSDYKYWELFKNLFEFYWCDQLSLCQIYVNYGNNGMQLSWNLKMWEKQTTIIRRLWGGL